MPPLLHVGNWENAAYSLRFRTRTHLIQPGSRDRRKAVPPPTLFFYERVHTKARASLDETLDWPWGFWSTDPHDDIEPLEIGDEDDIHKRKLRITFLGVSQDGEFVWKQRVGHCAFRIGVQCVPSSCLQVATWTSQTRSTASPQHAYANAFRRVEVSYHRFTRDECLVLREIKRWATPEDRAKSRFCMVEEEDDSEFRDADDSDEGDMMDWE